MKVGTVLALDLATTVGWAWHRQGMSRPFYGAEKLPAGSREVGKPADHLERFLRDLYVLTRSEAPISHFFFEAQHMAANANMDTVYRLIALGGIVEKFAYQVGAKCYKVNIAEWRKFFLGKGSGFSSRGENPKELAIQRAAHYGWHTDSADAADALGILDYSLSMIPDYPRPWRDEALMKGRQ